MSGWPFLNLVEARAWVQERVIEPALAGKVRVAPRFDRSTGQVVEAHAKIGDFDLLVEATTTLKAALARGELAATGIANRTGAAEGIPAAFWERAVVDATGMRTGRPEGRASQPNGHAPWRDIRIDRRQLEAAWPRRPEAERGEKLTVRAERDCAAWLRELAAAGQPGPGKTEARERAQREINGLSRRSFLRAWAEVSAEPGNAWMKRSGRKPRRQS